MPWYEEFKINVRTDEDGNPIPQNQINLSSKMPPIPRNPANVWVIIEGRFLTHELQWKQVGQREIQCLPIKPGQHWHVRVWLEKPYEGTTYTTPESMQNADPNSARVQGIVEQGRHADPNADIGFGRGHQAPRYQ